MWEALARRDTSEIATARTTAESSKLGAGSRATLAEAASRELRTTSAIPALPSQSAADPLGLPRLRLLPLFLATLADQ